MYFGSREDGKSRSPEDRKTGSREVCKKNSNITIVLLTDFQTLLTFGLFESVAFELLKINVDNLYKQQHLLKILHGIRKDTLGR